MIASDREVWIEFQCFWKKAGWNPSTPTAFLRFEIKKGNFDFFIGRDRANGIKKVVVMHMVSNTEIWEAENNFLK